MQEIRYAMVDGEQVPVLISDENEALQAANVARRAVVGLWREDGKENEWCADTLITGVEDADEEFLERIEEAKEEPFKLSYADQGCLYAARGYGKQKTSGYSIEVTACYEAERAVYIETALLGPDKGEEITEAATYPYVVVKMEYIDKQVIFE